MKEIVNKTEWPQNLIFAIFGRDSLEDCRVAEDWMGSLEYILMELIPDDEERALRYRYQEGLSYKEVGEKIGSDRNKAKQKIAWGIRRIRHPRCAKYLLNGVEEIYTERYIARIGSNVSPALIRHGFNLLPFSLNKDRIAIMQKKPMIVPSVFANKSSTSQMPRLIASCTSSMAREMPNPIGIVTYHFLHFFQSKGNRTPSGANIATFRRTLPQFFTEKLFQASIHALKR